MTAALLGGILALGAFVGLPGSLERSKPGGAPTIVVVSTILCRTLLAMANAHRSRSGAVGAARQQTVAPRFAAGCDPFRTPAGVWVVPVAGLANLEVEVPAGASGRLDLTLALVGRDDASFAEGHTALSINAPTVVTAGASAAEARPHEMTVAEAARADLPLNAARAPTAAETSEASSDLARSPSDAPSPSASATAEPVPSPPARGAMLSAPPYAAAIVPAPHNSPRARGLTAAEERRRSATKMITGRERSR